MSERNILTYSQSLEQRITPLQVQYVRMLEMTGPEVEDAVRRTVDENPALEVDDSDNRDSRMPADGEEPYNESAEQMQLADYKDPDDIPSYRLEARNRSADDGEYRRELTDTGETLTDSLTEQMRHSTDDPKTLQIADYIIGSLDDSGYLRRSADDIADDLVMYGDMPDATPAKVTEVLGAVRALEPAGVAARDLRDCMLLQLERRDRSRGAVETAYKIISEQYELFSKRRFDRLCSSLRISREQLSEALDVIHQLNPKPAAGFASPNDSDLGLTVSPDFSVECDDNGHLTVTLLSRVPHMVISRTFAEPAVAKSDARSEVANSFVRRRRDEATNFIKAIEMRNSTMFRIMSAIVEMQREFFVTGDSSAIKPMLLRDVSAKTGDDMSTVSRATSNKYVQTEAGIFALKDFFNERASTANDDESVSTLAVLDNLKRLIDNEDKRHPLSDDALTKLLSDKGFNIARRTVTKYRERLRLPVARLRRQL